MKNCRTLRQRHRRWSPTARLALPILIVVTGLFSAPLSLAGDTLQIKVMSFNILESGNSATTIGFTSPLYQQPRHADIAAVILQAGADIVAVQEDTGGTAVLSLLQADDPAWNRRGAIYSKFPLQAVSASNTSTHVSRAVVGPNQTVVVHNAHWWPGQGYGPFVAQSELISSGSVTEAFVLANSGVNGTPQRNPTDSLAHVQPSLDAREPVFVVGDFNEPSHLDWTQNYADNGGADRMTSNPTGTPLNLKVEWEGSKQLADAGVRDAYRTIFPDEIAKPGNTWTPPYANNTPGRRNYDNDLTVGGQVLDRIDRVEYAGIGVTPLDAAVVGENPSNPEHAGRSEIVPEIIYAGSWPSDHRAVIATFEIPDTALLLGDLNFSGAIDPLDWIDQFKPNHGSTFHGMHPDDTYALGDLDGDLDNDINDFALFKDAYNGVNGAGALESVMAVPEPCSLSVLLSGVLIACYFRRDA